MSKPRYIWWTYVRRMVEKYPARVRAGPVQADGLDGLVNREVEAVHAAIEETDPEDMSLIAAYYWQGAQDLETAAAACYISAQTAQRRHGRFLRRVAEKFFDVEKTRKDENE